MPVRYTRAVRTYHIDIERHTRTFLIQNGLPNRYIDFCFHVSKTFFTTYTYFNIKMSQLIHGSGQTTSSAHKFKCSLAFVLVDGKQIASGDAAADLVIKTEATKSPASASRQANTSSPTRYTLLVYVAKEVEPKVPHDSCRQSTIPQLWLTPCQLRFHYH
jgi:hypothetical protein